MFKKYWYFFLFFLVVLLLGFSLVFFSSGVTFSTFNNSHVYIELNDSYSYDVTACYGDRIFGCKSVDVSHDGVVDTSKIGVYDVVYYSNYRGYKSILVHVHVIDSEAPVISSSDSLSVCPNGSSFDVSYSAVDNYDGDITDRVLKKVFDDRVTLLVMDSFYNSDFKSINVVREDNDSPVITLNGSNDMSIPVGTSFSDPGYSVSDNCDGDISSSVSVSGSVDINTVGKYDITYSVSDSSGNSSSVLRHVSVYKPSAKGTIYLTFDDGPSQYTGELLDTLAKYNVKATFFVTGRAPGYNYNIKRAFDDGHAIGLHTNTHNYNYIYSSVDSYFEDLNAISSTVFDLTGEYSKLLRFPGGSSNTVSRISPGIMSKLSGLVVDKGYKYFDWNISSGDASGKVLSSDEYANNVIKSLGSGSYYIVLQHDTNANSVRAVGKIIEYGLSHGYKFSSLSFDSPTVHHKIAN